MRIGVASDAKLIGGRTIMAIRLRAGAMSANT